MYKVLVVIVQGACSAVNAIAFGVDTRVGVWCIGANGGLVLAPLCWETTEPVANYGAHGPPTICRCPLFCVPSSCKPLVRPRYCVLVRSRWHVLDVLESIGLVRLTFKALLAAAYINKVCLLIYCSFCNER